MRTTSSFVGTQFRLMLGAGLSLRDLPYYERGVLRSESHAVTDGVLDLSFAPDVGHVVEIALGVGDVEVDGGGNLAMLHRDQGCGQAGRAAGALGMSDLRLESGHRNPARVSSQS